MPAPATVTIPGILKNAPVVLIGLSLPEPEPESLNEATLAENTVLLSLSTRVIAPVDFSNERFKPITETALCHLATKVSTWSEVSDLKLAAPVLSRYFLASSIPATI